MPVRRVTYSLARLSRSSGCCNDLEQLWADAAESSGDNLLMEKDSDLLPWILGGLMIAIAALAVAVSSTNRAVLAPTNAQAPVQASPQTPAVIAATATPVPTPSPNVQITTSASSASSASTAQSQRMSAPTEPTSQIWECTIEGQKTFSDRPCGTRSSLREISPINAMEPAPVYGDVRSYEANYPPDYPYPSEQGSDDYSYPGSAGILVHGVIRPDHRHHPRNAINAIAPPAQHSKSASSRPR